jgi:hypothetical protein
MTNFEDILANSLDQLAGGASAEEVLARHPEHAAQLTPLLRTASRLERGREVRPSEAAKARVRSKLSNHMKAHPRHAPRGASNFQRFAISFAVLVLAFFVTGTAFAQGALPGDTLYGWKRTSERIWQAVSPDALGTDLALAQRRAYEVSRLTADPDRRGRAVEDYQEVLFRLRSRQDEQSQARVVPQLRVQQELLKTAGVSVPELDDYLQRSNPGDKVPDAAPAGPGE